MFEDNGVLLALYFVGLGLFLAELFVPSGGVIGIIATICTGTSICMLFYHGHSVLGSVLLIVTVVYIVFMVRWGLKRVTSTADLAGADSSFRDDSTRAQLVGCEGKAVTALRPAGVAVINGQRFDVVTLGAFVDIGSPIRVAEASGNRIVVRSL